MVQLVLLQVISVLLRKEQVVTVTNLSGVEEGFKSYRTLVYAVVQ